ncbi:hypothetical protein IQ249_19840 [Lusitaniella coriacea LEGE 07157]|uniref:FecR protein domain-containing protein n=1 Tax=Lusitaniella coriacea LEGE 07157 TaxID=945747 RepID=A0A8J7DZ01_9CYAN|nr:hypothetical protein [Lusitaniella coriacea]MBE9118149.1 hypothetical protein [Lusitaniella coriacea LEGE 07157]
MGHKNRFVRLLGLMLCSFCLTCAIALPRTPAIAQQITQATVVEILDSDQVYIQNRKARRNSTAGRGQQIRTGRARVALRLNNNAGIRLGRNSSLIVGSQCVRLNRGRAIVGGPARGCVGSVVAVTRGTLYLMEKDAINQGHIKVLEGSVEILNLENLDEEPVSVAALEKLKISPEGTLGEVEPITTEELESILRVFSGLFRDFRLDLPDLDDFKSLLSQLGLSFLFSPSDPVRGLW